MKPPKCALCGDTTFEIKDGGTVRFADYEPLPEGFVGHPKGLEWFCDEHVADARSRTHQTSSEAITEMWTDAGSCGC